MRTVVTLFCETLVLAGCVLVGPIEVGGDESTSIDFSRDIRPILAANCLACHGPDEEQREADLRLDVRDAAVESGAIVPGRPDESELIRRILSAEPEERMPPPDAHQPLTEQQKRQLRRWIAAGAKYDQHWAFVPPVRPVIPTVKNSHWPRNAIDNFVLARLEAEGWRPSRQADPYTLVRRLYLDLIGLPPTPEEADEWSGRLAAGQQPNKSLRARAAVDSSAASGPWEQTTNETAYQQLVDHLLETKHYGERWARLWLDLARYADTNGYEKDRPRSIWPYRDWVIRALNDDMPFDQFTVEQLAGDMLPEATIEQRIATGFHRNTMLNEEGGIDPLEYRFYAMVDRVATTGTVWLGLTTGCAQCHSHKYDPISHSDYYRLMALLNNADEPDLIVPDTVVADRRDQLEAQIAQLEADLTNRFPPDDGEGPLETRRRRHFEQKFAAWLDAEGSRAVAWTVVRPHRLETNLPKLDVLADGSIFSSGDITKRDVFTLTFRLAADRKPMLGKQPTNRRRSVLPITALRLEVLPDDRLPARGPGRTYYEGRQGDFFLSEVTARAGGKPIKFVSASHSYGKLSIGSGNANAENVIDGEGSTGWSTAGREGEPHQLVLNLAEPLTTPVEFEMELLFERHFAASLGRFRVSAAYASGQPRARKMAVELEQLLVRGPRTWTDAERSQVKQQFLSVTPELAQARKQIDRLRRQRPAFPTTMIMQERPADNPRPTYRHHRGEYLSPREAVRAGIPAIFRHFSQHGRPPLDDEGAAGADGARCSNPLADEGPTSRLEFARWLVSKRNPLIGRVSVNRAWRAFFGAGIVRTSGDFGTQAELPTHRELLDWLSCEFVDQGWSMKKLHRLIVSSATYRQSSFDQNDRTQLWEGEAPAWEGEAPAEPAVRQEPHPPLPRIALGHLAQRGHNQSSLTLRVGHLAPDSESPATFDPWKIDPENRLLARGPRHRADAEVVRDVFLKASGLLSAKMYGPSVYPPQPASVTALAYGNLNWTPSAGEDRYRRSLYTFSKRTAPFAAYTVFDSPTGESCVARRVRSDTPLQALTLLNDEMFLEMSRALARGAVQKHFASPEEHATYIFRRVLTRPPDESELATLLDFQRAQLKRLTMGELNPVEIGGDKDSTSEFASWAMLARAVMNLDEAITKQ